MPEKLPRPPRRLEPATFYADYAPALHAAIAADHDWPPWSLEISIRVGRGEDGRFVARVRGGDLAIEPGVAKDPVVAFECDRASWDLSVGGVLPRLIRKANSRLDRVHAAVKRFAEGRASRANPHATAELRGVVEIIYQDDAGDLGTYRFRIGSGDGPLATIRSEDADLWALFESGGKLVQLVKSRTQLDGDVGYLLRLAAYLEGLNPGRSSRP